MQSPFGAAMPGRQVRTQIPFVLGQMPLDRLEVWTCAPQQVAGARSKALQWLSIGHRYRLDLEASAATTGARLEGDLVRDEGIDQAHELGCGRRILHAPCLLALLLRNTVEHPDQGNRDPELEWVRSAGV